MKIINKTPHSINIIFPDKVVDIPPQGDPTRVEVSDNLVADISGIPLYVPTYGQVSNLPKEKYGTTIIVSRTVALACQGKRFDLVVPHHLVRDDKGVIIGCKALALV